LNFIFSLRFVSGVTLEHGFQKENKKLHLWKLIGLRKHRGKGAEEERVKGEGAPSQEVDVLLAVELLHLVERRSLRLKYLSNNYIQLKRA